MTANDRIRDGLAEGFAHEEPGGGCSGSMTVTQNEVWSYKERIAFRADDGRVYVTKEHFIAATSAHTQTVRRALGRAGYINLPDDADGWEVWERRRAR